MQKKDIAIVFDCGATNVRVIAMDTSGQILASCAMANQTEPDPHFAGGKTWDIEKLWEKLCTASRQVTSKIDTQRIAGTTVTTFGVDGAFTDEKGTTLYPVVSWQCQRTEPIMQHIEKYIPLDRLYKISGVYPYAFNTINKMVWFKENRPDIIKKSHRFLFIPSLLVNKLSGVLQNDATMMGTAMMADLKKREFSDEILKVLELDKDIFGPISEPGDKAGSVTPKAAEQTGIPENTPVFIAGHDTQFAIFGSGARINQPVLSSGTWEILMTRSQMFTTSAQGLKNNLTTELDAVEGVYNIGQNWLGSGVLEWFSKNFYSGMSGDELYETMIMDAERETPGSKGVMVNPAFYNDGSCIGGGSISGLSIDTHRGQLYRAFLESMAFRLREGLEALQSAGNFKAESIICVGGGSKNRLWNQLRANVCNVPVKLIQQKETTVLGAALFVFSGAGLFKSADEARQNIAYNTEVIEPSDNQPFYDKLYNKYLTLKQASRE